MRNYSLLLLLASFLVFGIVACEKEKVSIPPAVSEFITAKTAAYYVLDDPNSVYKIPVGITTAANVDRTINFTVTSPTGAAEGTQYTIASKSITIPAGQVVDTIELKGLFSGYPTGRKDTLVFTITGGDVPASSWGSSFNLVMQKYCPVDLSVFTGEYTIQDYYDNAPDGAPYTVTLSDATATGATTGTVKVRGLWGVPNAFTVNLDWADPANFTTSVPSQPWFMHGTYGQVTIKAAGSGTFSSCANTFRIQYEATVSAGSFGRYHSILTK